MPGPGDWILEVRWRDESPSRNDMAGVANEELERKLVARSGLYRLRIDLEDDGTASIAIERDALHAVLRHDPRTGAVDFREGEEVSPPPAGRGARAWLAEEVGFLWPGPDAGGARDHEILPLDFAPESFRAPVARESLGVAIVAVDRQLGGFWRDADGGGRLLDFRASVLEGEHWQGGQDVVVRGAFADLTTFRGLTGEWTAEERFRLRRDAAVTAEADYRVVVSQQLRPDEPGKEPANGR